MPKKDVPLISLAKAPDVLRKPDHRLMKMHTIDGPRWFIFPAGPVSDETAAALIARDDVYEHDSGLFPGNPQSYKFGAPK